MADTRVIHQGVRVAGVKEGTKFTRGPVITDPDELAEAAAKKDSGLDLQDLHNRGVISGDWKGVKATSEKASKKG